MSFDKTPQAPIRFGSGLKPVLSPYVAGLLTLSLHMKRRRRDIYVTNINSNESTVRLEGTKKLARLLEADPRIGDLRPEDIRVLIGFLQHRDNPELQFYALYALTNVDANGGELIKTEALPFLMQLMKSTHRHTKMQVLITLGRIANDFPELTKYLCENGLTALQNIVMEYKYNDVMLLNCSNFLAIVCRGICSHYQPQPSEMAKVYHIVNFLLKRGSWYEILLSDVLVAVSHLSPSGFGRKTCTVCLGLISDADPFIVVSVLQAIANIITTRKRIQWMMEGGLLQRLYSLSYYKYKIGRFQVCWILGQIVRLFGKWQAQIWTDNGALEIVENANLPMVFSGIKNLVTGQQIDFAEPKDNFIGNFDGKCSVIIGHFSSEISDGISSFSKLRWVAEAHTVKDFY
ncbi:hypothetical protein POM88_000983 [Heracleum sosnowskyi]|uniref:Uncharacterized protein n=1 Tax=Heracleum sosnowskyi TaxID=360622 RepID=A0AAD8JCM6_9APIA|nr:hypothetical protein POM88_000983 [Heracleum sosnowskyi]